MFPVFFLASTESIIYVSHVEGVDKGPTQLLVPVDDNLISKIVRLCWAPQFTDLLRKDCETNFPQFVTEGSAHLIECVLILRALGSLERNDPTGWIFLVEQN